MRHRRLRGPGLSIHLGGLGVSQKGRTHSADRSRLLKSRGSQLEGETEVRVRMLRPTQPSAFPQHTVVVREQPSRVVLTGEAGVAGWHSVEIRRCKCDLAFCGTKATVNSHVKVV